MEKDRLQLILEWVKIFLEPKNRCFKTEWIEQIIWIIRVLSSVKRTQAFVIYLFSMSTVKFKMVYMVTVVQLWYYVGLVSNHMSSLYPSISVNSYKYITRPIILTSRPAKIISTNEFILSFCTLSILVLLFFSNPTPLYILNI